ncbi:hypothetical protein AL515_22365 [Citrobacter sp. FDAARGOS_156]|nr:hypothetical protein AL515_22365 [Citrobacter sp. FDAARGOS_156]
MYWFSTELCRFLLISSYNAQEIASRCANVIVNAQSGNKFRAVITTPAVIFHVNSRKKTNEDAENFSAKKPSIDWQIDGGGIHLPYRHKPEPPLMCSTEGC